MCIKHKDVINSNFKSFYPIFVYFLIKIILLNHWKKDDMSKIKEQHLPKKKFLKLFMKNYKQYKKNAL